MEGVPGREGERIAHCVLSAGSLWLEMFFRGSRVGRDLFQSYSVVPWLFSWERCCIGRGFETASVLVVALSPIGVLFSEG